jgi:hypothetical protein
MGLAGQPSFLGCRDGGIERGEPLVDETARRP